MSEREEWPNLKEIITDPERRRDLLFAARNLNLDLQTALERAVALQAMVITIVEGDEMIWVTDEFGNLVKPVEYHALYKSLVKPYDLIGEEEEAVEVEELVDTKQNIVPFRRPR